MTAGFHREPLYAGEHCGDHSTAPKSVEYDSHNVIESKRSQRKSEVIRIDKPYVPMLKQNFKRGTLGYNCIHGLPLDGVEQGWCDVAKNLDCLATHADNPKFCAIDGQD